MMTHNAFTKRLVPLVLACSTLLAIAPIVHANTITVKFGGELFESQDLNTLDITPITPAIAYTGQYSFQDNQSDQNPATNIGLFDLDRIEVSFGGTTYSIDATNNRALGVVEVRFDGLLSDRNIINFYQVFGLNDNEIHLGVDYDPGHAFANDILPLAPSLLGSDPRFSLFSIVGFGLQGHLFGTITTLDVCTDCTDGGGGTGGGGGTPVPEPATWSLFTIAGVLLLAGAILRRRRKLSTDVAVTRF